MQKTFAWVRLFLLPYSLNVLIVVNSSRGGFHSFKLITAFSTVNPFFSRLTLFVIWAAKSHNYEVCCKRHHKGKFCILFSPMWSNILLEKIALLLIFCVFSIESRHFAPPRKFNMSTSWKTPWLKQKSWFIFLMSVGSISRSSTKWVGNRIWLGWDHIFHCWNQTQVIHCNILPIPMAIQLTDSFVSFRTEWRCIFHSHYHLDSCPVFSFAPIVCDVGCVSPRCDQFNLFCCVNVKKQVFLFLPCFLKLSFQDIQ